MSHPITTKIRVNGLRLHGYHGVFEQETRVGNEFSFDVELTVPWLAAADSDDVELTVSYADVMALICKVNATPSRLLEHVALRLHRAIVEAWPQVEAGSVRVAKIKPPVAGVELDSASVEINW